MSHQTVLVKCRECAGTGLGVPAHLACEVCLGQSHVCVDRAKDGGVPDGWVRWVDYDLPETPLNPLVLRSDAKA